MKERQPSPPWHAREAADVLRGTDAGPAGLSDDEAQRRLERDGPNSLPAERRRGPLQLGLAQFRDLFILVLLGAAALALAIGERQDAVVILVIVVLNAAIGAAQEWRAERAVHALRSLATPLARVRRGGAVHQVPSPELVVGDVLLVEAGDVVGADARVMDSTDLAVDEAALTGESVPVEKNTEVLGEEHLPLGDRSNIVFRGTLVTRGRAEAVVVATGRDTEVGRVAGLLSGGRRVLTPLQRRLARFGRHVAWAVLAVCLVVLVVGLLRGEELGPMVLLAVSLGVAAIPEALPAVVSISLAIGAQRMIAKRALVRRLPAVESLGSVTFACADKTGTLTEGRMRVEAVQVAEERSSGLPPGPDELRWDDGPAAWIGASCALVNETRGGVGDPTDVALAEAAERADFSRETLEQRWPRVADLPFDARRRRMSTLHAGPDGHVLLVKGGPEAVLERCTGVDVARATARAEELASDGLRVLAIARRRLAEPPATMDEAEVERDLELLGFVGLMDPPRPGAADSITRCRRAGITPVMITGDHPVTARAIAGRLGLLGEGDEVVTGVELAQLSDQELEERVQHIRVHARVSPEQKIRIVQALQAQGEFVAMTGDGVNDAPALKRAEIGVAMGRSGTDVAREAADMVLLNDDFTTMVAAVREGRRVFDNVRKFVRYTMTSNTGEIWTLLIAPLLGLPLPLVPVQILWINLVTDGLPGLALGVEPEERGVMRRPPRKPGESLFAQGLGLHVLWCGVLIGCLSIGAQAWAVGAGSPSWQTLVFTVLTLCQLAHVLAIRSDHDSLWRRGPLTNLALLGAVLLSVGLQMAVVYWPPLQRIFHTQALGHLELAVAFLLPLVVLVAVEFEKALVRRSAP